MSRDLWISDEVREWLTGLRTRDPSVARLVGEAVIAVLDESPEPPLVADVDLMMWAGDPREALAYVHQRQLVLEQKARRASADIATGRKRLELHIRQAEATVRRLGDRSRTSAEAGRHDLAQEARERQAGLEDALVDLRRELHVLKRDEDEAVQKARRLRHDIEGRRSHKVRLQIAYDVGRAKDTIEEVLAGAEGRRVTDDPAPHTAAARAEVETYLRSAHAAEREFTGPPLPLSELRLGAVTEHDVRVLFAIEPSGTVLLLGALEGPGEWQEQSVHVAEELFRDESGEDDRTKESFLREFFPGEEEERQAGAARLLARGRTRRLAAVRRRNGLTPEQVAARMNTSAERVAAIENAELDAVEVGALAAYVEAIGGRLEIVADLGTEQVSLRHGG